MKLSLLFFAVLGVAAVSAVPTEEWPIVSLPNVDEDYADFLALIPLDEIYWVFLLYVAEDPEVQSLVEYVQSEDFKTLVQELDEVAEYITLLEYLTAAGLHVYKWVNMLHEYLGLNPLSRSIRALPASRLPSISITGGVAGLLADIEALFPMEELYALHEEKLQNSTGFADLIETLHAPDAIATYDELNASREYQRIRRKLVSKGFDIDTILHLLKALIGMR